ncbi:MAG: FeoB-associated Cys-rich membrane protein [Desulfovibrionaceae bacterium]
MSETLQFIIVLAVIAAAGWFVFRRLRRTHPEDAGGCAGCSGCPTQSKCDQEPGKPL